MMKKRIASAACSFTARAGLAGATVSSIGSGGSGCVSSDEVTTPFPPYLRAHLSGRAATEVSPHLPASRNAPVKPFSLWVCRDQSWHPRLVSRSTTAAYNGAALRRSTTR